MTNQQFSLRVTHEPAAQSGLENMQIDEDLLNHAVQSGQSTLRFYEWKEPTISLGYFQKDVGLVPEPLRGLPLVHRLSGGGAILHDQELTYSLSVASGHPWTSDPTEIYRFVHEQVIGLLARNGLESRLRGSEESDPQNKSFLCFSRADPNDIVVGTHKIVGSAQRRRKGAVLQHGSILWCKSRFAAEFPGIQDLGCTLSMSELAESLSKRLVDRFSVG